MDTGEEEVTDAPLSVAQIRNLFPALTGVGPVGSKCGWSLLNNAAVAQTPQSVIDRKLEYLTFYNFNQGESSPISKLSAEKLNSARDFLKIWLNVDEEGFVILGQSASLLVKLLSISYSSLLQEGDEIVLSLSNHECHFSPWLELQKRGVKIRYWEMTDEGYSVVANLLPLINDRTKIVAFSKTSNLMGELNNCKEIIEEIRKVNPSVVSIVDGAQFVPHKCPDVQDMGCSFFFFASYKAFGPSLGVLYGRKKDFATIPGFGNQYQDKSNLIKQWELGARFQPEGEYGFLGMGDYFNTLLRRPIGTVCTRDTVVLAYKEMERQEQKLVSKVMGYLLSKPCWKIFGPKSSNLEDRVGIISIQHTDLSPQEVEHVCSSHSLYVRQGHLQAYRACEKLGIELSVGVVRLSVLHYNTEEEIDKLIGVLDKIEVS